MEPPPDKFNIWELGALYIARNITPTPSYHIAPHRPPLLLHFFLFVSCMFMWVAFLPVFQRRLRGRDVRGYPSSPFNRGASACFFFAYQFNYTLLTRIMFVYVYFTTNVWETFCDTIFLIFKFYYILSELSSNSFDKATCLSCLVATEEP